VVERSELAWQALNHYEKGKADYADCLIGLCGRNEKAEATFTLRTVWAQRSRNQRSGIEEPPNAEARSTPRIAEERRPYSGSQSSQPEGGKGQRGLSANLRVLGASALEVSSMARACLNFMHGKHPRNPRNPWPIFGCGSVAPGNQWFRKDGECGHGSGWFRR